MGSSGAKGVVRFPSTVLIFDTRRLRAMNRIPWDDTATDKVDTSTNQGIHTWQRTDVGKEWKRMLSLIQWKEPWPANSLIQASSLQICGRIHFCYPLPWPRVTAALDHSCTRDHKNSRSFWWAGIASKRKKSQNEMKQNPLKLVELTFRMTYRGNIGPSIFFNILLKYPFITQTI